ncbi:LysR family transcriptional regulator [Lachnoclostridium edouardi]|uniref:LysR family transcriptional regulator n=1 Tax=Lachnoclostridium edouardi TaxID=1926283 RepID=UPI000C79BFEB|nr:LysR family transcriptional regulator [Lachnoclostridium edouardi]
MDVKLLEYMIAIADCGNITKAAESLFITQSGLNQQLIRLENELNTQLFYRTKRHLHLTQAGKIYIDNAREILKIKKNTYTTIQDLTDGTVGEISFGIPFEHGVDMFIYISPEFNKKYPDVTVHLAERTVHHQQLMVTSGQLDMAFIMLNEKDKIDNEYIRLCKERLILGVPMTHPLAKYASPPGQLPPTLSLSQLKGEKFALMFPGSTMRGVIDPLFEAAGFRPDILFETTMNQALCRLVSQGLCCTILPQSYARDREKVAWFYLSGDPFWEWNITYSKTSVLSKAARYIIQLAGRYAKELERHWESHGTGLPEHMI